MASELDVIQESDGKTFDHGLDQCVSTADCTDQTDKKVLIQLNLRYFIRVIRAIRG